jgi:hypothetical protein
MRKLNTALVLGHGIESSDICQRSGLTAFAVTVLDVWGRAHRENGEEQC